MQNFAYITSELISTMDENMSFKDEVKFIAGNIGGLTFY